LLTFTVDFYSPIVHTQYNIGSVLLSSSRHARKFTLVVTSAVQYLLSAWSDGLIAAFMIEIKYTVRNNGHKKNT